MILNSYLLFQIVMSLVRVSEQIKPLLRIVVMTPLGLTICRDLYGPLDAETTCIEFCEQISGLKLFIDPW